MIVVGVDPGGRETGIAVIRDEGRGIPELLASTTIRRGDDGLPLTYVPLDYLRDVNAAILDSLGANRADGWRGPAELIAVERIEAPKGFAGGKRHTIDPRGLLATSVVFGAVMGRAWTVPVVAIRARGNGRYLPLDRYPAPLATLGKGQDKRRHERSAYDVATQGRASRRWAGEGYAP